ncbi:FtsB family cell division protein [Bombilactobacillus thymidiniphilus]|uniref:Septum formation initiator family protein n=1 Tax=Bombilactobacillus thymidiniphilus TaxID=2923363 RepID=A0ABY4PEC8_9LACO|nr:septum formation initiator family protein [Bombilactobacillus thymidiniphilus]UQS84023.1 septum formation initiator family protein [Bombilactobacillus thymidiniphilus]
MTKSLDKNNNVSPINLNNDDRSAELKFKRRVSLVHRRRIVFLLVVLLIVLLLGFNRLYRAYKSQITTNNNLTSQQHKLHEATRQKADLDNEIKQLHQPEYLDNLIRYRFNYSKDGEIIYNIPNEANKNINF